jgi:tetratricopeptide (TPR) repeat protein
MAKRRFSRGAVKTLLLVERNMRGDIKAAIKEINGCIKARGASLGRDRAVKARVLIEHWRNGWGDAAVLDSACKLARQGCKDDDGDYYTHWKWAYADKYRARSRGWEHMIEALSHYDDALAKLAADAVATKDSLRSVLIDRGETFVYLSQADVAVREMERALKLPGKTQDWHAWAYAFALHQNGDYRKSAAQLAPFLKGKPASDLYYNDMRLLLAASLARAGRTAEAARTIQEFRRVRDAEGEPVWTIALELERGCFQSGSRGEDHWRASLAMLDAKALPR